MNIKKIKFIAYEGGSICNENPFITPSTNALGFYAVCQTKDQSVAVIMVHETLFNLTKFNKIQTIFRANGFIALPPQTLTSFKALGVTLKYAPFLKIRNVDLYQERTILIVSKFQYTQCIGSRSVKLKPISRGISSEWYTIFVSYNFIV